MDGQTHHRQQVATLLVIEGFVEGGDWEIFASRFAGRVDDEVAGD